VNRRRVVESSDNYPTTFSIHRARPSEIGASVPNGPAWSDCRYLLVSA